MNRQQTDNLISFADKLIAWYEQNKRDLPWRHTTKPYFIWLSEIILQQTRVQQGLPYYRAFTEKFPTVADLAKADQQEVLRTWQGLGYYSRARNLHKCAQQIHQRNDEFPNTYSGLLELPGVGPYTAAAIASFAFNIPKAVVDGNVYRLLSRYFGIDADITTNTAKKQFQLLADQIIPEKDPATYNQAVMEFGSIQCTPTKPNCNTCPLSESCFALRNKLIEKLPVKTKKTKVQERKLTYIILSYGDKIYLEKRDKGIWKGLYQFLLFDQEYKETWSSNNQLAKYFGLEVNTFSEVEKNNDIFIHQLSHRRLHTRFWHYKLNNDTKKSISTALNGQFYTAAEIEELPKPILIEKYLKNHLIRP